MGIDLRTGVKKLELKKISETSIVGVLVVVGVVVIVEVFVVVGVVLDVVVVVNVGVFVIVVGVFYNPKSVYILITATGLYFYLLAFNDVRYLKLRHLLSDVVHTKKNLWGKLLKIAIL